MKFFSQYRNVVYSQPRASEIMAIKKKILILYHLVEKRSVSRAWTSHAFHKFQKTQTILARVKAWHDVVHGQVDPCSPSEDWRHSTPEMMHFVDIIFQKRKRILWNT